MSDDDRAATHLRRLGVNPITIARLRGYAEADDMTLRDLARYILSDYAPPDDILRSREPSQVIRMDERR